MIDGLHKMLYTKKIKNRPSLMFMLCPMIHVFYILDVIDHPKKTFFLWVTSEGNIGPDMNTIESVRVPLQQSEDDATCDGRNVK